jgi:hypothetical protein
MKTIFWRASEGWSSLGSWRECPPFVLAEAKWSLMVLMPHYASAGNFLGKVRGIGALL